MKALSDIGLKPEELPDLINKEDTLMKYQQWVIERFFPDYELNNKVITPEFGDKKESIFECCDDCCSIYDLLDSKSNYINY